MRKNSPSFPAPTSWHFLPPIHNLLLLYLVPHPSCSLRLDPNLPEEVGQSLRESGEKEGRHSQPHLLL